MTIPLNPEVHVEHDMVDGGTTPDLVKSNSGLPFVFLPPGKNQTLCPVVKSIPFKKKTGENETNIHFSKWNEHLGFPKFPREP